jgi:ATP-dependent Clp protease ATP-binding subunit ClpA
MPDPFDRLTPAARAVLVVASQVAARLRHSQIDSIHMVLGLSADPARAASRALADLMLGRGLVRASARRAVGPPGATAGLTPGARAALSAALSAAGRRRHARVGTLHLLAGVLAAPSPAVAAALKEAALSPPAARAAVAFLLDGPPDWLLGEEGDGA